MRTQVSFSVELDDLAIKRGLDMCVAVDVEAEVAYDNETVFSHEVYSITHDGKDVRNELSARDLCQIERMLYRTFEQELDKSEPA